jgi:hypothetical protein
LATNANRISSVLTAGQGMQLMFGRPRAKWAKQSGFLFIFSASLSVFFEGLVPVSLQQYCFEYGTLFPRLPVIEMQQHPHNKFRMHNNLPLADRVKSGALGIHLL